MSYPDAKIAATNAAGRRSAPAINPDERSGLGILEDNDITANASAGVAIGTGGNPTLRRNRINRNEYHAVRIYQGGKGVVEDNNLTGNKQGAWDIAADSRRNVTRARNRE
jgi:parallel beta-helix repeat protein